MFLYMLIEATVFFTEMNMVCTIQTTFKFAQDSVA